MAGRKEEGEEGQKEERQIGNGPHKTFSQDPDIADSNMENYSCQGNADQTTGTHLYLNGYYKKQEGRLPGWFSGQVLYLTSVGTLV